jgi:hypothetical protein
MVDGAAPVSRSCEEQVTILDGGAVRLVTCGREGVRVRRGRVVCDRHNAEHEERDYARP